MENSEKSGLIKNTLKVVYALRNMGIKFLENHQEFISIDNSIMNNPIGTLKKEEVINLKAILAECNSVVDKYGDNTLNIIRDKPKTMGFVNIIFVIIIIALVTFAVVGGYLAAKYL